MENIKAKNLDNELNIISGSEKENPINNKKPIFKIISDNFINNELNILKKKRKSSSPKEKKIYSEAEKSEKMLDLLIKCLIFDISKKIGFHLKFPPKGWIHFLDYWESGIHKSLINHILYYNNAEIMEILSEFKFKFIEITLENYYINDFCKRKDFYLLKFIRNNDLKKNLKDFDFIEYIKDNYAEKYRGKNVFSYSLIRGFLSPVLKNNN